ncbi:MAG: hypothetical protein P3X22_007945 [Thermoprotei archaeon]|nr:hypothetical protein [Thermoprotei archaeon]
MLSSSLEKAYLEALRSSQKLSLKVSEGELIVYSRGAEPPAYILLMGTIHAGLKTRIASTVEAQIHILPYRDYEKVTVFTISRKDPRAVNAAITAAILGARVTLVAPPLHEAYEERVRMRGVERVVVTSQTPLLTASIAALRWTPELMGLREARVRGEILNLEGALKWLVETYGDRLASKKQYDIVAYTPSTRPGAYYYCRALGMLEPIPLEAVAEAPRNSKILALATTTEEQEYKDIIMSAGIQGVEVDIYTINTDPLTAGLYSLLIAMIITGKPL